MTPFLTIRSISAVVLGRSSRAFWVSLSSITLRSLLMSVRNRERSPRLRSRWVSFGGCVSPQSGYEPMTTSSRVLNPGRNVPTASAWHKRVC